MVAVILSLRYTFRLVCLPSPWSAVHLSSSRKGCVTALIVVVILLRHTWSKNEAEAGNYQGRRRRGDSNEEVGEGEDEKTQERKDQGTGRRPGAEVESNTFPSCSLP